MVATIDKNSFTARKTSDANVFLVGFDFTDDTIVDVNQAWLYNWKHVEFTMNTTWSNADRIAAAQVAMATARKPTDESTLETSLKANFGTTVVRVNPSPTATPMEVKIKEVDAAVVFKTQAA